MEISQGNRAELPGSTALLPQMDNTAGFEQYMTRDTTEISRVLDSIDLSGKTVIEIGVGSGALTKLLLERGAVVFGSEIDPTLVPSELRSKITLLEGDYKDIDFSSLCSGTVRPILIANPPYRELSRIAERVIEKFSIDEYVLFIPALQRMVFPDAHVVAHMHGNDFAPPAIGQHLIIHGKAVEASDPYGSETQTPPSWKDLTILKFSSLSPCESRTIDQLVKTVINEIQKTPGRPVALFLTEDPVKLASIREQSPDTVSLVKTPLYSHPQYIRKLLELPDVLAVVRPESAGDDFLYTVFQIRGGSLTCTVSRLPMDSPPPLHS